MNRLLCLAVVLVVVGFASPANAQLALQIYQDGGAAIVNVGATPLIYDGYQIQDAQEPGRLIPGNLRSVESLIAAGQINDILSTLGAGALGFAPAGLSPNNIAELTAGAGGFLQPGARWSLGQIFPPGLPHCPEGFTWSWNGSGGFNSGAAGFDGICPEPSTLTMCGLAFLSLLAFTLRRTQPGQLAST